MSEYCPRHERWVELEVRRPGFDHNGRPVTYVTLTCGCTLDKAWQVANTPEDAA